MADTKKVIGVAALVTVGVGTANSFVKEGKPPSSRFLIGCGVAFFVLSAMSEFPTGEEVAKGLALGVMSTVLLNGEAGGLLTYINNGEFNTKKHEPDQTDNPEQRDRATVVRTVAIRPAGSFRPDTVTPFPGLPAAAAFAHGQAAAKHCPTGMHLVNGQCVGTPAGRILPGPGRPVGIIN